MKIKKLFRRAAAVVMAVATAVSILPSATVSAATVIRMGMQSNITVVQP